MKDIQALAVQVMIVAAGVMVAGAAMSYLRGNDLVDRAHDGFDS